MINEDYSLLTYLEIMRGNRFELIHATFTLSGQMSSRTSPDSLDLGRPLRTCNAFMKFFVTKTFAGNKSSINHLPLIASVY